MFTAPTTGPGIIEKIKSALKTTVWTKNILTEHSLLFCKRVVVFVCGWLIEKPHYLSQQNRYVKHNLKNARYSLLL